MRPVSPCFHLDPSGERKLWNAYGGQRRELDTNLFRRCGPSSGVAMLHIHEVMPSSLAREICGFMHHRDGPALGFDLFEDALQRYSFEGIQRMARVFHDGSAAEW